MRKKSIFLMIIALLIVNCKRSERDFSLRTEIIGGIEHVYNSGKPLKGKTPLEGTEILRIEPYEVDRDNPPLFETAVKDDLGNLYLADHQNVRVYKFDSGGRPVAQFLSKGEGPGEFPRFGDMQIADNHLWIIGTWPLKIAEFTLDGQFINEWMFRTFRNFYLLTQVISEDRFLTVSYHDGAGKGGRLRISYESLERYRNGQERGLWLWPIDTQKCRLIIFDRDIDRESVVQYGLTFALSSQEMANLLSTDASRISFEEVTAPFL